MKPNVGPADRLLRLILGIGLGALALFSGLPVFAEPLWFWLTLGLGAVLIGTSAIRFCPLYAPFGISTCKVSR
ncbi:MAG: DUF2892 domain-containing protein [Devosia sp.]|jgi:hypothetical protein|uniref:YgaP family membrane protein n=1 Tax=Devosia sp. TaxID=1871048 RepID=UPI001A535D3F|nr:DUF2892 domain-containing protein [Devosia sp.]MBL8597852.1 DUF2892 domain-containing protein [Devosia sp.]